MSCSFTLPTPPDQSVGTRNDGSVQLHRTPSDAQHPGYRGDLITGDLTPGTLTTTDAGGQWSWKCGLKINPRMLLALLFRLPKVNPRQLAEADTAAAAGGGGGAG